MAKSRVLLNFMLMNWKDLGPFGMLISSILYSVAFFTTPPVTKAILDAAIDDLRDKGFVTIRRCSTAQMTLRTDAENTLKALLKKDADYVNMMCGGVLSLIISSGFDAYTPEYVGSPTTFRVRKGALPGTVDADWPLDPNNHGYVIRYFINVDGLRTTYTEVNAGTTEWTITNLTIAKEYGFQLAVVYTSGKGAYGDPVFIIVT